VKNEYIDKKKRKKRGDIVFRTVDGEEYQYEIVFSKRQIKCGIRKIAKEIYNYCLKNDIKQLVFVGIATGAIHFMIDVERALYYEADKHKHENNERFNVEVKTTIIAMEKSYVGDKKIVARRKLRMFHLFQFQIHILLFFDNLLATGDSMKTTLHALKKFNSKNIKIALCVKTINDSGLIPDFFALSYKKEKFFCMVMAWMIKTPYEVINIFTEN
jgi:hypoxanthine-guanine phosphoribosyltransferase